MGKYQEFDHELNKIVDKDARSYRDLKRTSHKPWWDESCIEVVKKRKAAYRKLLKKPNRTNLLEYRSISHEVLKFQNNEILIDI